MRCVLNVEKFSLASHLVTKFDSGRVRHPSLCAKALLVLRGRPFDEGRHSEKVFTLVLVVSDSHEVRAPEKNE